jgi:uncharacterized protein YndB with AHSA1/START domain
MADAAVVHSTFVVERVYPVAPEKVFAAFSDPAKKRRWFGDGLGHTVEEFTVDFRDGGHEYMRYRFGEGTPFPGVELVNEGWYQDIVPNERIVTALAMTIGGKRVSGAMVTIELLPTAAGTELICTHQGVFFEGSGGPQMRETGWKTLFEKLAKELAGE